ncbi:TetR/AcrR family transcriptional regulator [Streptomyces sp. HSW2009]|uniref:TetR/AcrR family transcriptional regulator n=1 Tax=Streptomyces sp. HSW2009 TaxID=3142890 RepID=UPI0032ED5978
MSAIKGARERARDEVTAAIKDEARRQLAEGGAAKLSLRAVARELGMVSSALYRYFPSRDDLLTELIIDAYDALGEAAERALAATVDDAPASRWQSVCRGVRTWALAHPHEYALIYGSPVPGYRAPQDTTGPAARVALALIAVLREAHEAGELQEVAESTAPEPVRDDAQRLADVLGIDLPAPTVAGLTATWAQLFGLVSFEVFGQFNHVVEARDVFFDQATAGLGRQLGILPGE